MISPYHIKVGFNLMHLNLMVNLMICYRYNNELISLFLFSDVRSELNVLEWFPPTYVPPETEV